MSLNHYVTHLCKTLFDAGTSESIRGAPVSVHHASRVPGSAPGHGTAVVEGLARLSEPSARRGLLVASCWGQDLVLGFEPAHN